MKAFKFVGVAALCGLALTSCTGFGHGNTRQAAINAAYEAIARERRL